MLPKIIHYCWFGNNKKPKLIKKCIKSWRKFCPDFKIIEWNESNFDVNCCQYVKEAYESKKWAFVSDYCRFYVLNKFGGVYLDTDVQLIKPIDEFLTLPFAGFEKEDSVNTGLIMGCEQNDNLCLKMLEEYNQDKFIVDGKLNLHTVCQRVTDVLVAYGLQLNNQTQEVFGYKIFASEYFNPFDMNTGRIVKTKNTVSIHHYAASWCKKSERFRGKVYRLLRRLFGEKFANKIRKILRGK